MARTLIEISEAMLRVEQALIESAGEVDEALLDEYLESQADRDEKLDNYAALIREIEARIDIRKQEINRLRDLVKSDESLIDRLKDRLKWFFQQHDLSKLETSRFRLSLVRHGGKTPVHVYPDPEELPESFRVAKITYRANTDALREALEQSDSGTLVDESGQVIAVLGERGSSVRIR